MQTYHANIVWGGEQTDTTHSQTSTSLFQQNFVSISPEHCLTQLPLDIIADELNQVNDSRSGVNNLYQQKG